MPPPRLGRPFRLGANENEFTRRLRGAYAAYNITLGRSTSAPLDPELRAEIRTTVGRDMFTDKHSRPPADDRELTGFIARLSRTDTTAVAGYDLTFTPVKSVSALWALAPLEVAKTIEDCHHRAVADTLAFLEQHACFTRMGTNGVAQVDTTGFLAAAFDHRDSRAGDPNLHTHVAISNKVCTTGPDGIPRWLALDGQPLYKAKVSRLRALQHVVRNQPHPGPRPGVRQRRRHHPHQASRPRNHRHPNRTAQPLVPGARPSNTASGNSPKTSKPSTTANPPPSNCSRSHNRPPWKPATPNTNPAPWPSSASSGAPKPSACSEATATSTPSSPHSPEKPCRAVLLR